MAVGNAGKIGQQAVRLIAKGYTKVTPERVFKQRISAISICVEGRDPFHDFEQSLTVQIQHFKGKMPA